MADEHDTDIRQVLVGDLRRLARHIRAWDDLAASLTAADADDPDAASSRQYRAGLRRAVALAFHGNIHTDRVDQWIDTLLDDDDEEAAS